MEENTGKRSSTKRWMILLLKITVTVVSLWYVSGKIELDKVRIALGNANWLYLLGALILFVSSKLIAAVRLNIYFSNIGIHLPAWENMKLYWLGMFYNLFLPGSISGDAYKVILLSRKYKSSYKKTTSAVLLDRISGLAGLGIILAIYAIFVLDNKFWVVSLLTLAIIGVIALYIILRVWLKDFLSDFLKTLSLGILVQVLQVICIYLIMLALGITLNKDIYVFLFLLSSIASVLPLTIGGLGLREVVFLEGSAYFLLPPETGVVISLIFYLITLIVSAAGVYFVYKDPLSKRQ